MIYLNPDIFDFSVYGRAADGLDHYLVVERIKLKYTGIEKSRSIRSYEVEILIDKAKNQSFRLN